MKHYEPFRRTPYSFEHRAALDASHTAIGMIVVNFSHLREGVTRAIAQMLPVPASNLAIVTGTAPFRARVQMMAALVRELCGEISFNSGPHDPNEVCGELASQCLMAEGLKDSVLESTWQGCADRLVRTRMRVHAASGLRVVSEPMDAAHLLDIADYICCVATDVDEFFFGLE